MNIEKLVDSIRLFESEIIESGFKRDVQDYLSSLPNNKDNIVTLRDIASKIIEKLTAIYSSDLPDELKLVFPKENIKPFTDENHNNIFNDLTKNKEIELSQFFEELNRDLTNLNNQLQVTITEIDRLKKFFIPYLRIEEKKITSEGKAILSIIFKDDNTISSLKSFTKTINLWNRTLPIYHQIISSSSPEEIEMVEIQNGSIDVVVNLDLNVALNIAELFNIGFKGYLAYLSYKSIVGPIVETYGGNRKLLASEKDRESGLLDNIGGRITEAINRNHNNALKKDKKIEKNIKEKVKQVTNLIASHIIKGNDIKLLALPKDQDENKNKENEEKRNALKKVSGETRNALKKLPDRDKKKLLEKYVSDYEKDGNS